MSNFSLENLRGKPVPKILLHVQDEVLNFCKPGSSASLASKSTNLNVWQILVIGCFHDPFDDDDDDDDNDDNAVQMLNLLHLDLKLPASPFIPVVEGDLR